MANKSIHANYLPSVEEILKFNGISIEPTKYRGNYLIDGKPSRVCVHNLTGVTRKNIVIEYCTDTKSDMKMYEQVVFICPQDLKKLYVISVNDLYTQLNSGIENDRVNFKITNTGDILKNSGLCISVNFESFKKFKGLKIYSLDEMIDPNKVREDNKRVLQYEPLVNKITKQFSTKVAMSWDDIKSMAYEGLMVAFDQYDESKSNMSFTQFAAFAIRNNILTSLDNESRTVKMSAYAQKKANDVGEPVFNSVRIDVSIIDGGDDDRKPKEIKLGMYENEKFSNGDVYGYLYTRLEEDFSTRDCEMFYMSFGLKNRDIYKGKEIAQLMGVSEGCVSQRVKKMCQYIRKDNDLCEMLASLCS